MIDAAATGALAGRLMERVRMTFEECKHAIQAIRERQGTARPMIRVDFGGSTYRGRLARVDSDRARENTGNPPFGLLVLDDPGLGRGPQTILQIDSIAPDAISDSSQN